MLEVFASGGTIDMAAKAAAMKPRTVKSWLAKYPEFKAAVDEVKEMLLDEMEGVLLRAAKKAEFDPRYQQSLFRWLEWKVRGFKEEELVIKYKDV